MVGREDEDSARILEAGIHHALRTGADAVVVHGSAEVVIPLVDSWTAKQEHRWDTHLRSDLNAYSDRRHVVDIRDVAADLLAVVSGWRYRPRTTGGRIWWYRTVVQRRKVLLRLHNAHSAQAVRAFAGGAPGSLIIATTRTRLLWLVSETAVQVAITSAPHTGPPPAAVPDAGQRP
ncbi:hypothetical protein [Amycolatopsis orientalis]|uniref:hypothetical protein n=1 Tax=Amycolatopsis orientalis TaxID=31958 RepID=UPI00055B0179|nr:hypothetical protein [Amycolatopsis orientalis]